MATLTRGERNKNLGNLRPFKFPFYEHQTGIDSEGHAIFDSYLWGLRALAMDLSIKINRGVDTVAKIAEIYAPSSDKNDPSGYALIVKSATGISPNDTLTADAKTLQQLVYGFIIAENGYDVEQFASDTDIMQAVALYQSKGASAGETINQNKGTLLAIAAAAVVLFLFVKKK
jgi:hypothetical protein